MLYPDSVWEIRRNPRTRKLFYHGTAQVAGEKLDIIAIPADRYTDADFTHLVFNKTATDDKGRLYRMKVVRK